MSERDIDQLLVVRVQGGERKAFDLLVAKYQRRLARLVGRLVYNHAEVEEVVQEAFIRAYRAIGEFRGDSAFYSWLYRIAVNQAKNHIITQSRQPTGAAPQSDIPGSEPPDAVLDTGDPEALLATKQTAAALDAALAALPFELRTAIVLREIDGLNYAQIAEIMTCPIGTVRSRIFRAREMLASRLAALDDRAPKRTG